MPSRHQGPGEVASYVATARSGAATSSLTMPCMAVKARAATAGAADPEPLLVSDWPEDIAHLALLMVTEAGHRLATPTIVFELLDLPLFDAQTKSAVPHNARHDAEALRDYVLATDH